MLFFLKIIFALEISKQIPNFIISKNEYYTLSLDNYFSGDFLEYSSPDTNFTIFNKRISHNYTEIFIDPYNYYSEVNNTLNLLTVIQNNAFQDILFQNSSVLYFIEFDRENTSIQSEIDFNSANFIEFSAFSTFYTGNTQFLLIGTVEKFGVDENYYINQFYSLNYSYSPNISPSTYYSLAMWDVLYHSDAQGTNNFLLCNSDSYEVPLIYSIYGNIQVFLYNFTNIQNPFLIISVPLKNISQITFCQYSQGYFFYLDDLNVLHKVVIYNKDFIEIASKTFEESAEIQSVYLDSNSMLYILSENNLLVINTTDTNENGFSSVMTRKLELLYENITVSTLLPLSNYLVMLATNESGPMILVSSIASGYPLIFDIILESCLDSLEWYAFETLDSCMYVFFSCQSSMYLVTMNIEEIPIAIVNWNNQASTADYSVAEYQIIAKSQSQQISQSFSICSIISEEKWTTLIPITQNFTLYINFDSSSGFGSLFMNQILSGPAINMNSVEISNTDNYDKIIGFNSSFYQYLTLNGEFDNSGTGLSNFAYFGDYLIFYNSSYYMIYSLATRQATSPILKFKEKIFNLCVAGNYVFVSISIIKEHFLVEAYKNLSSSAIYSTIVVGNIQNILYSNPFYVIITTSLVYVFNNQISTSFTNFTNYGMKSVIFQDNILYTMNNSGIYAVPNTNSYQNTTKLLSGNYSNFNCFDIINGEISVTSNTSILVYDIYYNYNLNKNFTIYNQSLCSISQYGLIISVNQDYLFVYNSSNFVHSFLTAYINNKFPSSQNYSCNIQIAKISETDFNIFYYSNLTMYIFYYNALGNRIDLNFMLLGNCSYSSSSEQLVLTINANNFNNLHQIELGIEVLLNINGKFLYADNSLLTLSPLNCLSQSSYPLTSFIFGQNASYLVESGDEHFRVNNNRITRLNGTICEFPNITFIDLDQMYGRILGTSPKTIFICNISENSRITNFSIIYDINSLVIVSSSPNSIQFFTGASYEKKNYYQWKYSTKYSLFTEFYLILWEYNSLKNELNKIKTESIPIRADNIRVLNFNNGSFYFVAFNSYSEMTSDSLFTNDLIAGMCEDRNFSYTSISFNYLNLSTVYVSDIAIAYDPLFDTIYFYVADFYSGIYIFDYYFELNYVSYTNPNEPVVGLALSQSILYVTTLSTTKLYYELQSFTQLVLSNKISALNEGYYPLQSSLAISEYFSPDYLAAIVTDGQFMYLEVIDNKAKNTSCIFQIEIVYYEWPAIVFYNFSFILLKSKELILYEITDIQIEYGINSDCDQGTVTGIIVASNLYNNVSFNVTFSINKDSQGNLSYDISTIEYTVIGGCVAGLILVAVFIYKCFSRKRKRHVIKELFVYDFKRFEKEL